MAQKLIKIKYELNSLFNKSKETFLLLPKGKGKLWYWTTEKKRSTWYPSIQVIEQKVSGSWDKALDDLSYIIKGKLSE